MPTTIFDKIVSREIDSHIVWESDTHIAFLTPFPNTPGFTVVIPKQNIGDNVFSLSDEQYLDLMKATKTVANILEKALGVKRVALVFEGTGVAHVHAKLIPLYGDLAGQTDVWVEKRDFTEEYRGFITTHEGPKMEESKLEEIRNKILAAQGK